MIDIHLQVVYQGTKHEVNDVRPADLVALERTFNVAIPSLKDWKFEHLCFLVWRTLRRHGESVPDVFGDEFLDEIESVETLDSPFVPPADDPSPG